jgi:site-specific DNA recombinase
MTEYGQFLIEDQLGHCHRAYLDADPQTRRLFNQALFERLYLDEDGIRVRLAEPFKTLLGPEAMTVAGRRGDTGRQTSSSGQGAERAVIYESRAPVVGHDWSTAYIRHIRAQRKANVRNRNPSRRYGREGLKEASLVPPAGFEPATPGLGVRRSIP